MGDRLVSGLWLTLPGSGFWQHFTKMKFSPYPKDL
jgi:hypothetical protein